jgi:outer membrane protein assembly factor BamB
MTVRNQPQLLCILSILSLHVGAAAQTFKDPAPPAVQSLSAIPLPEAKAQEGLKFHGAPRPLAPGAVTHDWRAYNGPSLNATSSETPLVTSFGKSGPTMVWEVPKGQGFAAPAVIGERLVLFHRVGDQEVVECLNAETGKRFWKSGYPTEYSDRYGFNGGPRCQPVSDGEFVYTLGAAGKLHCFKLTTGQILWKRDILKEFKLPQNFFGVGATPLLEGDVLIVNVGAVEGPCVAGFDRKTGKMVWGAGKDWTPGYAAPVAATIHGKRRVFVFTGGDSRPAAGGLLCIDPVSGKVDFTFPWRSRTYTSVNASAPLIIGNQIFISECYGEGGALLEVNADGSYRQVWTSEALNTHFMTAVHKDGYLYGVAGHGPQNAPLVCIDLKTGKEMWRLEPDWEETIKTEQGDRKARLFPGLASLMLVDGRCLLQGEFGHLAWLDLNPKEYKEVERVRPFLAPETWSMPALSRGLLYVCQNERGPDGTAPRLICYDLRGEKKQ